jgi:hypothetical protein
VENPDREWIDLFYLLNWNGENRGQAFLLLTLPSQDLRHLAACTRHDRSRSGHDAYTY